MMTLSAYSSAPLWLSWHVGWGLGERCRTGRDERLRWDSSIDEKQEASNKHFHPACQGHQGTEAWGAGITSGKESRPELGHFEQASFILRGKQTSFLRTVIYTDLMYIRAIIFCTLCLHYLFVIEDLSQWTEVAAVLVNCWISWMLFLFCFVVGKVWLP